MKNEIEKKKKIGPSRNQISALFAILVFAGISVAYKSLASAGLNHTALMFVGVPTLLAAAFVLVKPSKTTQGALMRSTTLALLMAGILFGEGFVCILMAAPFFYAITAVIGWLVPGKRLDKEAKKKNASGKLQTNILIGLLVLMSLEGVSKELSFPRQNVVVREQLISGSVFDIKRQLSQADHAISTLPFYLRLGFPHPKQLKVEGLEIGDRWTTTFSDQDDRNTQIAFKVIESDAKHLRFKLIKDTTKISNWLTWTNSEVSWEKQEDGRLLVSWRLGFTRDLDPSWYFGFWQRYAVGLAADVLIDSLVEDRG